MNIREIQYANTGARPYIDMGHRVSWGAVFAGTSVATAVFLSLTILGAGIGLISAPDVGKGVGIGAAIYGGLSALISCYCGGWIAGRLSAYGRPSDAVIHGVICWSATVLMALFLVGSTVGKAFSGLAGLAGGAIRTTAEAVGPAAANQGSDAVDRVQDQVQDLRRQLEDRLPPPDQARDQARQAGETAARTAGAVGLGGGLLMLLELLAFAGGARAGTRMYRFSRTETVGTPEKELTGV